MSLTENDALVLNKMGVHVKGEESESTSAIGQEGGGKQEQEQDIILSFVLVPADTSSPLVELVATVDDTARSASDPFMDLLEPYFQLRPGETVNISLLEKQADAEREAGCSTGMCPHVSPITLQRASEAGTLEKVKIGRGSSSGSDGGDSNNIYMYLDESANLKERPINSRAIHYAKNIYNDGDICGDIFLARIGLNNRPMQLLLHEVEKEPWFMNDT